MEKRQIALIVLDGWGYREETKTLPASATIGYSSVIDFLKPRNDKAEKMNRRFSGMLSFELKSDLASSVNFLESLKIISVAESLGVVESLIEHPASMTHASISAEDRAKIGLSDGLIRLSVGIEDADDLIADISQALNAV